MTPVEDVDDPYQKEIMAPLINTSAAASQISPPQTEQDQDDDYHDNIWE